MECVENCRPVQKLTLGLKTIFSISSKTWPLSACQKVNLLPQNQFWHFVPHLTFGLSKSGLLASALIFVFRPKLDFGPVQKLTVVLKNDFGISSQTWLLACPKVDVWPQMNFGIWSHTWLFACPKVDLWPSNLFWHLVPQLQCSLPNSWLLAFKMI